MSERNRPGGEMSSRILDFFWIADCSGSMADDKIQTLNYAIRQTIPDMRKEAENNPNASLVVRTVKFSDGATWHGTAATIDQFTWDDLAADGLTAMGMALELVADELGQFSADGKRLPPVLVLLTDGQPTDDFKQGLDKLMATPWGKKAVRIGIAIGKNADHGPLEQFTGNKELVLEANNPQMLVKFIKWASTVVRNVSAPRVGGDTGSVDVGAIPVASADDDDIWDVW